MTTAPEDTTTTTGSTNIKALAKTAYVVLTEEEDGSWRVDTTVAAISADRAIREVAIKGGTYIAVPARSWKPVKVTLETQTVVKLG